MNDDFVFGTLATDTLRIAQLRAARSGVGHGQEIIPLDPRPGEAVTVRATIGPQIPATGVVCYYTTDGSLPEGAGGVAENGEVLLLVRAEVAWDTLLWGYVTTWEAEIPGQAVGTLVRYRIEALGEQGRTWWASEIAGVAGGEPPAGIAQEDLALFAMPGAPPLWPLRRAGSYAYHYVPVHAATPADRLLRHRSGSFAAQ
jgi:hypothetical protein